MSWRNVQGDVATLGTLRGLTADLPDDVPVVVVMRKAHDVDHFYAEQPVTFEQVDLLAPAIVLSVEEPEDLHDD